MLMEEGMQLIGAVLRIDVMSHQGALLLSAGTVLTKEHVKQLTALQYSLKESDIEHRSEAGQETEAHAHEDAESHTKKSAILINTATEEIKSIFDVTRFTRSIPLHQIQKNIIPIIQEAVQSTHLFTLLDNLQSKDDYTYRHNIGVGVIATMIGKWLKLSEKDLALLTIAATLHDIGKTKIPEDILNKPGKLSGEEYALIKKHTIFGYELIKQTVGTSHRMALVALQHHEREDGGGYPFKLKGDKIDFLSKIVAVADIFHAMSSARVYHNASPFFQVINQMSIDKFGKLEPKIVKVFVEKMMSTMVGHDILLSDGRKGKIILVHPNDPIRPLICIDNEYIDLSNSRHLEIEKVYG